MGWGQNVMWAFEKKEAGNVPLINFFVYVLGPMYPTISPGLHVDDFFVPDFLLVHRTSRKGLKFH